VEAAAAAAAGAGAGAASTPAAAAEQASQQAANAEQPAERPAGSSEAAADEDGEDDDSNETCGFCRFMKGGGCRTAFIVSAADAGVRCRLHRTNESIMRRFLLASTCAAHAACTSLPGAMMRAHPRTMPCGWACHIAGMEQMRRQRARCRR